MSGRFSRTAPYHTLHGIMVKNIATKKIVHGIILLFLNLTRLDSNSCDIDFLEFHIYKYINGYIYKQSYKMWSLLGFFNITPWWIDVIYPYQKKKFIFLLFFLTIGYYFHLKNIKLFHLIHSTFYMNVFFSPYKYKITLFSSC